MTFGTEHKNRLALVPGNMTMEQPEDMTLFTIIDHALVNMTQPKSGIQMKIKMKRKIMSEMMTYDHLCHHLLQAVLL